MIFQVFLLLSLTGVQSIRYSSKGSALQSSVYLHDNRTDNVFWGCNALRRGVALTFDDGPGENTVYLLDSLKQLGVKATFFVVGGNVMKYPDIILRAHQEGHEIGSHTWGHVNLTRLYENGELDKLHSEIIDTEEVIMNITGVRPRLIRPPYGAINREIADILADRGYKAVMWTGGCLDWWLNDVRVSIPYILNGMADAGSLLCMHDSAPTTCTDIASLVNVLTTSLPQTTVNPQGRPIMSIAECLGLPDRDQ